MIYHFFEGGLKSALSYIDPGTGSMLFSVVIGVISVGFFALKAFFNKITSFSLKGRKEAEAMKGSLKKYVIYSEGKQYWNVFKPIVEEFHNREIECYFYTSDESDPCFQFKSDYIKAQFIGKGNVAYTKLNMLEADLCLMTTPSLDVYQLKRSKHVKHYSHIVHAPGDATLYRLFGLDYFDSVLLTGEFQKKDIKQLESLRGVKEKELVVVGCTYLDVLKSELDKLPTNNKNENITLLVAPSWGEEGLLKKYGLKLLNPLIETGFNIIIRPHPQTSISEKDTLLMLQESLKDKKNIEWDFERNNIIAMSKSDILISDFSGIIFDYLFLQSKPVIYTSFKFDKRPYDAGDIEDELWQFDVLNRIGIKLDETGFSNIKELVEKNITNNKLKEMIESAKAEAYTHQGESGKMVLDTLIQLREKAIS
ncbi:CDP-glycerol glycerophosphotransferase family protein [bacterium]|nr:CDP-glycerol glycerophosphotransferase family protein [bacterium]